MNIPTSTSETTKGVCALCDCTWDNACFSDEHGACWWIDDGQNLCSHCYYGLNEEVVYVRKDH